MPGYWRSGKKGLMQRALFGFIEQKSPPAYFPLMTACRRQPTGWRSSAPSKGLGFTCGKKGLMQRALFGTLYQPKSSFLCNKHFDYQIPLNYVGDISDIVEVKDSTEIRRYLLKQYSGCFPGIIWEERKSTATLIPSLPSGTRC